MLKKVKDKIKSAFTWVKTNVKKTIVSVLTAVGIITVMGLGSAVVDTPNNANLVGYWSFEDATSTTATDFSGNGNTGTLTNMANDDWVNGRVGKALDFDGVNDYVTTGSIFPIPANISVFAWVKPDVQDVNDYIISDTGASKFGLALSDESGKKIKAFLGSGPTIYTETYTATLGQWQHIGYTYSGSALQFYVNGVALGSPQSTSPSLSGTATIEIARLSLASAYFNGQIDEVRVYSDDLTASQVLALYNSSKYHQINAPQNDKITNGLVGCWTMNGDETTTTTLTDCSGNGYDGALTGSPSPVIGRVGQAIDLNGTNQYATMTGTDKFTSTYTKTAWIKVPSNATSFAGNILSSSGGNITVFWALYGVLSAGHAENLSVVSDPAGVLPADTWFHVAVTFDNGSMKLYKDGVEIDSATGVSTPSTTSVLQLGVYASSNNFKGQIDEARVYNRALSANEIYRLYNTKHTLNSEQNDKLTSGLVGYWTMNGADTNWGTNRTNDVSGNGNNGVLTGLSTTTSPQIGKVGQALYLANSPTIAIPSSADFAYGTGDFTWSMWVNPTALSGNDYIIDHGANGGVLRAYASNYEYYTASSGNKSTSYTPVVGQWDMFTAVRRSGTVYLYINGVEKISFADATNFGTQSVTIGNFGGGGPYAWDGKVDEVRLYNRALTASEITRLYNMGN